MRGYARDLEASCCRELFEVSIAIVFEVEKSRISYTNPTTFSPVICPLWTTSMMSKLSLKRLHALANVLQIW
jgi:hypothetical protein